MDTLEGSTPRRRDRVRAAAVREMKDLARRLLVDGGPPAISLRAIAREMGMTAPAIYRYYPSLDALVRDLVEDLFEELRLAVTAAGDGIDEPRERLLRMARAFRDWSVGHPAEFGLMFGNPVPGVAQFEDACVTPEHAGARFGAPFLDAFADLQRQGAFRAVPAEVIEPRIGRSLGPYRATFGPDVPVEVIYAYLSAWTRLYGLVAMEVFGHLGWAVTDVEPLFELELTTYLAQLAAPA